MKKYTIKVFQYLLKNLNHYKKLDSISKAADSILKQQKVIEKAQSDMQNISTLITKIEHLSMQSNNHSYKRIFDESIHKDYKSKVENISQTLSNLLKSHTVFSDYIKANQSIHTEMTNHLRDTGKAIDQKAVEHAADITHKILLTFLRCFQIFIFILVTYSSVAFATMVLNNDHLVIPRGLFNIVPSESPKVTPNDLQTGKPETSQSVTNSVTHNHKM